MLAVFAVVFDLVAVALIAIICFLIVLLVFISFFFIRVYKNSQCLYYSVFSICVQY